MHRLAHSLLTIPPHTHTHPCFDCLLADGLTASESPESLEALAAEPNQSVQATVKSDIWELTCHLVEYMTGNCAWTLESYLQQVELMR